MSYDKAFSVASRLLFIPVAVLLVSFTTGHVLAQQSEGPTHHGTLSTSYGENTIGPSINDQDLRKLVDEFIPMSQNTLVILTQCYGGDIIDDFEGRANTTILSATAPGEVAYYGGYETGAGNALRPGKGRTSNDIHSAGNETKWDSETSSARGPVASLEDTSADGTIRSRHILYYAGQPDKREGRDYDQRDAIKSNFKDKLNTTVTTVGHHPDSEGNGQDGWDYPGNFDGLKAALKEIGAQMNEHEQFILFVSDHGGREKVYNDFELEKGVAATITLNLGESMLYQMLDDAAAYIESAVVLQAGPTVAFEEPLEAGDLTVELVENGATVDRPEVHKVVIDDDESAPDADTTYRLVFPFSEADLIPWEAGEWPLNALNRVPVQFILTNNLEMDLHFDYAGISSGSIARPQSPGATPPGGDAGTVSTGPNPPGIQQVHLADGEVPGLQLALTPTVSDISVEGISVQVNGTLNAGSIAGLNVIADVNGNGLVDAGEDVLGSTPVPGLGQILPISFFSSREVVRDTELIILVTAQLAEQHEAGFLQGALILNPPQSQRVVLIVLLLLFPVAVLTNRRPAMRYAVIALLIAALVITIAACGGGGGGGNGGTVQPPAGSGGTLTVTLTEIGAVSADDSTPVDIAGMPMSGPVITVAE